MDRLLKRPAWRWGFLGVVGLLFAGACALFPAKAVLVKMLPFDNKSEVSVVVDMPRGTTLERTTAVSRELTDMLSNLIKNALEASPQGGRVVIGLREGATLDVTVSNAGAVPAAIRPRFFEKFATAGKKDGTGLGTYGARLIAETHGAKIAMDALLGELPEESPTPAAPDEALDVAELADLPALEEPTEPVPVPAEAEAVAVPVPTPVTVAATAPAIDLDALDKLIQTAKGPEPEPEPEQPGADVFAALVARLDTLEAGLAGLAEQLRALPEAPNGVALAETLADRLEATLDSRLDALRLELAPAETPEAETPDLEALRAELLAAIETATPDRDSLVQDLRAALTPDFEALRQGFPQTGDFVGQAEMASALAATRDELLAKLPEATPDRAALLDDFAELLETRLAALRQDLPGPDTYVTPKGLADALTGLRESLSVDMLTARGEEVDRIVGLELGADDYVVKPFSPRELILRLRAVLKRHAPEPEKRQVLSRDGLSVDLGAHRVTLDGEEVALTATEFRLLAELFQSTGRVLTRDRLLNSVWGYEFEGYARTVDTHAAGRLGSLARHRPPDSRSRTGRPDRGYRSRRLHPDRIRRRRRDPGRLS